MYQLHREDVSLPIEFFKLQKFIFIAIVVETSFLKLSRFSQSSRLTSWQCRDWESRSRPRREKSRPPGLVSRQGTVTILLPKHIICIAIDKLFIGMELISIAFKPFYLFIFQISVIFFRRQAALISVMYNPSALQCKNCGLRYSPTDMIAYSQHLDWHFRMKRREKENARKAQSRNWYFERIDWINSDEISDGEKGKNKSNSCFNNVEVIISFCFSLNKTIIKASLIYYS